MKYLPLYRKWMKTGKLPKENGLCSEFGVWRQSDDRFDFSENPTFFLMTPSPYKKGSTSFWAGHDYWRFTPLRQNIVLFLAAINNEL